MADNGTEDDQNDNNDKCADNDNNDDDDDNGQIWGAIRNTLKQKNWVQQRLGT